jgi:hypothetical protein
LALIISPGFSPNKLTALNLLTLQL